MSALGSSSVASSRPSSDRPETQDQSPQVSVLDPSHVVIGSNTLTAGAAPSTIDGYRVDLATPGDIVVGSATVNLMPAPDASGNINLGADHTQVSVVDPSHVVVGSDTINDGASPTTAYGHTVELKSNGLLIYDSSTLDVATTPTSSGFGSQYTGPNALATIKTISGSLTTLQPAKSTGEPSVVTLESGQTLTRGGNTITLSGTPLYYGPSDLVSGSTTMPLPTGTEGSGTEPTEPNSGGASATSLDSSIATGGAERAKAPLSVLYYLCIAALGSSIL